MTAIRPAWIERFVLLVLCLAVAVTLSVTPANATSTRGDAEQAVAQVEREDPDFLVDMHGNAMPALQSLEVLRFDATKDIESEIDRLERLPRQDRRVLALYRVLGFVKDSASTDWLMAKLRTRQSERVYDACLRMWMPDFFAFGNDEGYGGWPWLTGRNRWIAFFIGAFDRERSSGRRVDLLTILNGFDDPLVMQFFVARSRKMVDPQEILLVEMYFRRHGFPVDETRIGSAVRSLRRSPENRDLLLGAANAIRSKAFVPYLLDTIDQAEEGTTPTQFDSRQAMEHITFQVDPDNRKDWRAWYAQQGAETREQWIDEAIRAFDARLEHDPAEAERWFENTAIYRWNDIALLPYVRSRLVPRRAFASALAGWINLTYRAFDHERLRPIAGDILHQPGWVDAYDRQFLIDRGYLPPVRPVSWKDYVVRSNTRM